MPSWAARRGQGGSSCTSVPSASRSTHRITRPFSRSRVAPTAAERRVSSTTVNKVDARRAGPDLGAPFYAGTHPNGRELSTVPLLLADGQADLISALITMGVAIL